MEIETTRSIQPIYKYLDEEGKEVDCVIPFSCENKFNVFKILSSLIFSKCSKWFYMVPYVSKIFPE